MTPTELRAQALQKVDAAGALLAKAEGESRGFTTDEQSLFDSLHVDAKTLQARADTIESQEKSAAELRKAPEPAQPDNPSPEPETRAEVNPKQSAWKRGYSEYLVAVRRFFDPSSSSFSDPAVVRLCNQDKELRAASGMEAGVPSEGGFLVPPEFSQTILERSIETGLLASRCTRQPVTGSSLKLPCLDETSRANGSRGGGLLAYWVAEAEQMTASRPKFGEIELSPNWLTAMVYCTDTLMEDAPALSSWLSRRVPEEFGFKSDDAIYNGTGAGMPLGILNAPATVSVAKETNQKAKTILPENIVKMYSRCEGVENAAWFINRDVLPQLYLMSLTVGTGGGPVFMPAGGLSGVPYNTILGLPVIMIEQCATLGTTGDIMLANLGKYLLAERTGMDIASSIHIRFDYNETAYRFRMRLDGQPAEKSALTPFSGSANTISPFVKLATRA